MKSLKLFPFLFLLAACTGGTPKYDATGTFEATEVIVSAEASGKLLSFDIEEGTTLIDGQEVGIIDTVQLYLKKLQLEASVKSVEGQLTLLGKTQPVTLKANQFACYDSPMLKREVCGGDFEATIDRTAFGLNYGVDWGFPKNVRLVVQIEAVKQ